MDQKIKLDMSSGSIDSRLDEFQNPEAFQNYPKHMTGIVTWNEQTQFVMLRDISYTVSVNNRTKINLLYETNFETSTLGDQFK